jgi:pilus assembly protein Flp/PilA
MDWEADLPTPPPSAWSARAQETTMLHLLRIATGFFTRKEEGASLVEYGLLIGLIALACIAAITLVSTDLQGLFTQIATALQNA